MISTPAYKVIGTRPLRPDGIDKVTGRAVYGADVSCPGCCTARWCAARTPMPAFCPSNACGGRCPACSGRTGPDLPPLADKIADLGESVVNMR